MTDETRPLRRKPPRPKPLAEEVRHILASVGLPGSDTDERAHAHGIVINDAEGDAVYVEWFTSRTLRESAATEQREAIPEGPAVLLHRDGRRCLHHTIAAILRAHGGMKTDVIRDQGVLVRRTPDVTVPEPDPADQPRTVGEVLSDALSPMRGFLISDDDENNGP
ncbi:hypothetical protein H9Y04_17385 [Streptomyces sp. TRM66268-LWL]|uniref:Uncharacterized protein n=1 Tax=Streptomyces polyasparticus TaxID=2767826 RepID=A0ABR7SFS3_9ACTN|nr:hypothetical protein [Streptomyces polyasparticus]MBC9714336.1 hypothetical protein [Streptomyces polyasparticus]